MPFGWTILFFSGHEHVNETDRSSDLEVEKIPSGIFESGRGYLSGLSRRRDAPPRRRPAPEKKGFPHFPALIARSPVRSAALTCPYLPVFLRRKNSAKQGINGCFFPKPGCRVRKSGESGPYAQPDSPSPPAPIPLGPTVPGNLC